MDEELLAGMMGQEDTPDVQAMAAPAPIQMDQATFMQILQMMMQAQQQAQQPPQGMPPGPPQGAPPEGMPPDPRIAQALMQGGM